MSTHTNTPNVLAGLFEEEIPDRVHVSTHAQLAWLERVNAEEEYPASACRSAFERSARSGRPGITEFDGLVFVYDIAPDDTAVILTVYPSDRRCPA